MTARSDLDRAHLVEAYAAQLNFASLFYLEYFTKLISEAHERVLKNIQLKHFPEAHNIYIRPR